MLLQTNLFLGDVEFFQVVDQFLLKAVAVHILDRGLGHEPFDALLGGLDALAFQGGYLVHLGLDEVHMLVEILFEHSPFVAAELVGDGDGLAEVGQGLLPLLVAHFVVACRTVPKVGHRDEAVQKVLVAGTRCQGDASQGIEAFGEQFLVKG